MSCLNYFTRKSPIQYLLSHLFIHSHSVDIPIHLGARDGHDSPHRAERLLVHVCIHILEAHLNIVFRNLKYRIKLSKLSLQHLNEFGRLLCECGGRIEGDNSCGNRFGSRQLHIAVLEIVPVDLHK